MPKVSKSSSPQNSSSIQSYGSGDQVPVHREKLSRLSRHHAANCNNNNNIKIDIQQPQKGTRDKIKSFESSSRRNRINEIARMLDDRGELSTKEKDWLENMSQNFRYNQIKDLLRVPKFWWPSTRGVWKRADRNRIRMQTLKAVLNVAMKTIDTDTKAHLYLMTADRAIKIAAGVRKDMTTAIDGKKHRLYHAVTRETLHNPELLQRKKQRMIANAALAKDLPGLVDKSPLFQDGDADDDLSTIGTLIVPGAREPLNKDEVVKAVKPLLTNDLLDLEAVARLQGRLKNPDKQTKAFVTHIAEISNGRSVAPADRQKVRSLLYLGLAYVPDENLDRFWVQADSEMNLLGLPSVNNVRPPRYKALPNLPRADQTTDDISKAWLSFWEVTRNPVQDDVKQDVD